MKKYILVLWPESQEYHDNGECIFPNCIFPDREDCAENESLYGAIFVPEEIYVKQSEE